MTDFIFTERAITGKDWATVLFIVCLALVAVNRTISETRFAEFMKLAFTNKYMKIYKDSGNILTGFTISMFIVQLLSFTFLAQFILSYYGLIDKTSWIAFIQIFTFITVFILSKYIIEKIIATSFNIEEFSEMFNLQKISYRTYLGLLLLPVNIILFYNSNPQPVVLYIIIALMLVITVISYLTSLRLYQNLILSKLFYFILYLCTLEIAPYYFIYYWFTNSK